MEGIPIISLLNNNFVRIVLISTYELGHQPFGVASPAAWLRREGFEVKCIDLAVEDLSENAIRIADAVAFYAPMHTATRLAIPLIDRVKALNPTTHICFYGLYAPMNENYLRQSGVQTILGGEFEEGLVNLCKRLSKNNRSPISDLQSYSQVEPLISLNRQQFLVPDRHDLPGLSSYVRLNIGDQTPRIVGYVEASRGCKHLCRHCPIVPVYQGRFRIVQQDIVLQDIRQQVAAGAKHVTFGDPDFFNGIGHAIPLVQALHGEFPDLSYDVTIKVEHLLKYASHLPLLRETGCILVTTAVESIDDDILAILDKGHTREDFINVVHLFRGNSLALNPTFVAFSPWTTLEGYQDLLTLLRDLNLVDNVAPIQLAIRLLIPDGSRLLELPEVRSLIGPFDPEKLSYTWIHEDSQVEQLYTQVNLQLRKGLMKRATRREIFSAIESCVRSALNVLGSGTEFSYQQPPISIPYLTEPWYC